MYLVVDGRVDVRVMRQDKQVNSPVTERCKSNPSVVLLTGTTDDHQFCRLSPMVGGTCLRSMAVRVRVPQAASVKVVGPVTLVRARNAGSIPVRSICLRGWNVDTHGSNPCARKGVRVRIPPKAFKVFCHCRPTAGVNGFKTRAVSVRIRPVASSKAEPADRSSQQALKTCAARAAMSGSNPTSAIRRKKRGGPSWTR